jgi:hypothetical protein
MEPTQVPFWHLSDCVQALLSEQGPFSLPMGSEQFPVAGSHVPAT